MPRWALKSCASSGGRGAHFDHGAAVKRLSVAACQAVVS